MADTRFRLFRLPFLALCRILDLYGPCDIIQLSLCSKRSLRVVKQCWKKRESITADLSVEVFSTITLYFPRSKTFYRFIISKGKDVRKQRKHNIRIGDSVVPSTYKDSETLTFWEDKIFGIEQIVRYIKDLFDTPIIRIGLKSKDEFIDTMDCVMKIQESVQNCTLDTAGGRIDKCMTHLLDNCKITGELRIYGGLSRKFKNDWNIQLDGIYISNGPFITFQNLTNMNCKLLWLERSSLTNEDLNQFLKHWQNGGNPRLKFLYIVMKSINQEAITSGIDTVSQPQRLLRYYEGSNNFKSVRGGGLDIQRNDGTIGTIFIYDNWLEFGVGPTEYRP